MQAHFTKNKTQSLFSHQQVSGAQAASMNGRAFGAMSQNRIGVAQGPTGATTGQRVSIPPMQSTTSTPVARCTQLSMMTPTSVAATGSGFGPGKQIGSGPYVQSINGLPQSTITAPKMNSFAKSLNPARPVFNPRSSGLQMAINSNSLSGAVNQSRFAQRSGVPTSSMASGHFSKYSARPQKMRATSLSAKQQNGDDEFTVSNNDGDSKPFFAAWGGDKPATVAMGSEAALNPDVFVPDMERRMIMNYILLGSSAVTVGAMAFAYIDFFVPPQQKGGSGATAALDALGNPVKKTAWLANHPDGDRNLVQGLKGDAHYLIVKGTELESYALNAVCTHLGCVVPWSKANNKFMCPCHGSQYDETGKVVRGPAPLSLALAHLEVGEDDTVGLTPWTETDFRTGQQPWWK